MLNCLTLSVQAGERTALSAFENRQRQYYLYSVAFIRLDASGIIAGLKWLFPSHAMPFFSHLAQAKLLKKAFAWLKIAHFSHYTDPTHQVYLLCLETWF